MHMKYIYTNKTENKETLRLTAKLKIREKGIWNFYIENFLLSKIDVLCLYLKQINSAWKCR